MHFFKAGLMHFLKHKMLQHTSYFYKSRNMSGGRRQGHNTRPGNAVTLNFPTPRGLNGAKMKHVALTGADTSCGGFRRASRSWDRSCHSIFLHSTASLNLFSACVLSLCSECVALHHHSLEHHRLLNSREQAFSKHFFTC